MKSLIILIGLIFSTSVLAAINDQVTTAKKVVDEIRISASGYYYFSPTGGNWDAPGCPNAQYAYFGNDYLTKDQVYSAVLASKLSKTPIQFVGLCGDAGGADNYIRINYVTF